MATTTLTLKRTPVGPSREPSAATETAPADAEPPGVADARVTVANVNVPGYTSTVEAPKYHAMKAALLRVLPMTAPGLTQSEMMKAVVPHLPASLFPGGAKSGWWVKCVQLDLEAKGELLRDATVKPLRWQRC